MTDSSGSLTRHFRLFRPLLAGATLQDRLFASFGALVGISLTGLICALTLGIGPHLILLVPPMGASAVLVFAVPASPLAQPWPTIGGNVVSALVGILVGHLIHEPALAAGVAVGVAIASMSLLRCIHPPGGAAALVAVFGGPAVEKAGFLFPLVPVGLNAVLLVGFGLLFHRFSRHSYPHVPVPPAPASPADPKAALRSGITIEDVDRVVEDLGETFDISTADLARLLREIETRALARNYADLTSADIMARGIIAVLTTDPKEVARDILVSRDLRVLPVLDESRRVVGVIGLAQVLKPGALIGDVMDTAITAAPGQPAIDLADQLRSDSAHAVVVVDEEQRLLGLVTQTDLLAVLVRGVTRTMRQATETAAKPH